MDITDVPHVEAAPHGEHDERTELRKEAATMALYVAICLLAALSAVAGHGSG